MCMQQKIVREDWDHKIMTQAIWEKKTSLREDF